MTKKERIAKTIEMRSGLSRPKNENCNWKGQELRMLTKSYLHGVGISELALMLQRSETAIIQKLESNGLCDDAKIHRRRKKEAGECLCGKCLSKGTEYCRHCEMKMEHSDMD